MLHTLKVRYWETVIPPRCRKPRPVERKEDIEIEIPEVLGTEAPVAVIVAQPDWGNAPPILAIRSWGGRFWSRYEPLFARANEAHTPYSIGHHAQGFPWGSREQALQAVRETVERWLVVDGELYGECGEPRYEIHTQRLGHNHGGTSLSIAFGYNSNIAWTRYVRADQLELAIATAEKIALGRGDTKDVPMRTWRLFDVLRPEFLTLDPFAWGGKGDEFIARLEAVASAMPDANSAAWGVTLAAMRDLTSQEAGGLVLASMREVNNERRCA